MKFPRAYTLKEMADLIQTPYVGSEDFPVLGINEIHVVTPGDIVFVDHPKYYSKALESAATIVLINKEVDCPKGKALLISDDPFRDFNKITNYFKPFIAASSSISNSAKIASSAIIQPNVFIGHNVQIGEGTVIHSNVSIYDDCIIGNNVTIHSGTVLGANAFYYKKREDGYDRLLSSGRVVIEDNVDLGANCTIDRGVTADTTIKKGAKLDNQIQVGHDTIIGERCLIASHTGIAGCTIIENDVTIWGQVGITSGVTIGAKAIISAKAGVSKSLEGGKHYFGIPAEDFRTKYKELAAIKKIPEILEKLNEK